MYKNNYYVELDDYAEKILRNCEFLGCGHNGIVYSFSNNKVIKIFNNKKTCLKEYNIFLKTKGSKYFPNVYKYGDYYIVRDLVNGERLDDYIKKYGFNRKITINIINLLKEFKDIGFSKIDIRCKDLYISEDYSLKVIDPKNNLTKKVVYPRHLMKGLNKLGVLDEFLFIVKCEYPQIYGLWSSRIYQYLKKGIK